MVHSNIHAVVCVSAVVSGPVITAELNSTEASSDVPKQRASFGGSAGSVN